MRTFLAVRPPAEALDHLSGLRTSWPAAPERWHVTLAFLGEVAEPSRLVEPLVAVCARHRPLSLRLAGSGAFGRGGPVWVGVEGDRAGLTALAEDLGEACRRQGVDVERRPYRPHVTVGRRGHPDPRLLADYAGPWWTADEVELVASRLRPTVRHDVLHRVPLTGLSRTSGP